MVIARNAGLAVHHVTVHDLSGKLTVEYRPRSRRRDGAQRGPRHRPWYWNATSATNWRGRQEVDTHIEPLEPELPLGSDAALDRVEAIKSALARLPPTAPSTTSIVCGCATPMPAEIVNFHCRAAPSMSVIRVHTTSLTIERAPPRLSDRKARHQPRRAAERGGLNPDFERVLVSDSLRRYFYGHFGVPILLWTRFICINESLTLDSPRKLDSK